MKKYLIIFFALLVPVAIFWPQEVLAMPIGALLYRTSSNEQMYGYSGLDLIKIERGILTHLYTGHVGIYVGAENGVDYVVEALANGVVKTPAKDFVNRKNGEKLIGVKLPIKASPLERVTAVLLAKNIAATAPAYDFNFHTQKGPGSGQWICSGLAEKIYESSNVGNPYDLRTLQYDSSKYGVDITPDGFDNSSVINSSGDVLSQTKEFSKISGRDKMLLPASEKFGYNVGLEKNGERYLFIPFTQFSQPSLTSVSPDIVLESSFDDEEIRGKQPTLKLIAKWSFVNNPLSSIRLLTNKIKNNLFPHSVIASKLDNSAIPSSSISIMPAVVQSKTNWSDLFPNPGYKIIENSSSTTIKKPSATTTPKYSDNPEVDRIIDGDTFVLKDGRKVRYLDIDAPEITSASRKTTECRGNEAVEFNRQLLSSGKLILVPDPLAKKDSYSRWLFYVYLLKTDGSLIFANQAMVESGLADVYICPANKPSCPETGDKIRQQIIEEAGLRAKSARDNFLATCAAEKAAAKLASSTAPIVVLPKINSSTPTSTIKIATSTTATTTIKISTTTPKATTSVITKPNANPASGSGGGGSTQSLPNLISPLITKIFSSGDNHWLELYNPNSVAFDLAVYNYRLEKSKTAIDPAIMLRFSETSDVQYLSDSKIPPNGNFLVVGSKADENWRGKAQAIVINPGFTWGKSGYTFYSGLDAISSPDDSDIIEKIGFGSDALYFSATSAPALTDNDYLGRVKKPDGSFANFANNFLDFQLFPLEIYSSSSATNTTPVINENSSSTSTSTETVASSTPTSTEPLASSTGLAINSPDLTNVWHFDDCEGNYAQNSLQASNTITLPNDYLFDFGKNGCAIKLSNSNSVASVSFNPALSMDEASFAFYYFASSSGNLSFWLNQASNNPLRINLSENGLEYFGNDFMGASPLALSVDNNWHQIVATFDSQAKLVVFYQDGQEISRITYPTPLVLHDFGVSGSEILVDELAFWHRPLFKAELLGFFQIGKPFYTSDLYNPLMIPQKAYYWYLGEVESQFHWYDQPKRKVLPADFMPRDFSYEFWWRNSSYPEDGRIVASLLNGEENLVSSVISLWYSRWSFGAQSGLLYGNDPFIPTNNLWHHFALTYDSQEMMARWYIDGQEIFSRLTVWLKKPVKEIMIKAENYPFELSDFSLWEGALSSSSIQELVNIGKPFGGQ
ncbi:MAG: LamG-like jellyroll fold domain-containing protein [Patescibacteria group bacterium]